MFLKKKQTNTTRNLPSSTFQEDSKVQEAVPTKMKEKRTLVMVFLKERSTPPETYLPRTNPREIPIIQFLQKKRTLDILSRREILSYPKPTLPSKSRFKKSKKPILQKKREER